MTKILLIKPPHIKPKAWFRPSHSPTNTNKSNLIIVIVVIVMIVTIVDIINNSNISATEIVGIIVRRFILIHLNPKP